MLGFAAEACFHGDPCHHHQPVPHHPPLQRLVWILSRSDRQTLRHLFHSWVFENILICGFLRSLSFVKFDRVFVFWLVKRCENCFGVANIFKWKFQNDFFFFFFKFFLSTNFTTTLPQQPPYNTSLQPSSQQPPHAVMLAAISIYSTEISSRIQIIFTLAKLAALGIIILGGIVMLFKGFQFIF